MDERIKEEREQVQRGRIPFQCPIKNRPCIEENCAWFIPKGFIKTTRDKEKGLTIHEHIGCCAIKHIAGVIR